MEDYKEKYEKLFEHARQAHSSGALDDATLEELFPELRQDNNERIAKALIDIVKSFTNGYTFLTANGPRVKDVIEWLEKQSEKKPVEWNNCRYENIKDILKEILRSKDCPYPTLKEDLDWYLSIRPGSTWHQPKFRKGDWVVKNSSGRRSKIIEVNDTGYTCNNCCFNFEAEDDYHLFTFSEAKSEDGESVKDEFIVNALLTKFKGELDKGAAYEIHGVPIKAIVDWLDSLLKEVKDNDIVYD